MTTFTDTRRARAIVAALTTATALLAGCGDKSRHAQDGDTGAAAPATKIDLTRTPRLGESTAAVAQPTGKPDAMSGDTTGSRAKAPAKGPTAGKPARP